MTIIITGAAGFVGRELAARLARRGAAVVAVDSQFDALPARPGLRTVRGDIADPAVQAAAFAEGCSALVHLATVPGGAAEANPAAARATNIDATLDLLERARAGGNCPRVVFASSIAVFGEALPRAGVDDDTPLAPRLVYGAHKAMIEVAVAMMSRRGEIDGISLRLPGIVARPAGPSGMKSAFISALFHALRAGERFVCPVSAEATIWAQSVTSCAANLDHALTAARAALPESRALTLPALRVTMTDLASEVARQCRVSADLVRYAPDAALEAAFGAYPPLDTPAAEAAGFSSDGDLAKLVARALAVITGDQEDIDAFSAA